MTGPRGATPRPRRTLRMLVGAAAGSLALAAALGAAALASGTITIGSASNSKLGKRVAVNAQGHTLYALSGESRSRQFCKSSECLRFWPPARASSRNTSLRDGAGVHGQLRILTRSGGILQVTLRGLPLYRYSGDRAKGEVNGEGIVGPGGHIWHAAAASPATNNTPTTAPTMPTPSPPSPSPGYTPPKY